MFETENVPFDRDFINMRIFAYVYIRDFISVGKQLPCVWQSTKGKEVLKEPDHELIMYKIPSSSAASVNGLNKL